MQHPARLQSVLNRRFGHVVVFAACLVPSLAIADAAAEQLEHGKALYMESCADCHGERGQGVDGAYEIPLVGDDSIGQLAELIGRTMPEGSPEECVADDAQAVAEYVHHAFYSEAAQVRNRPPRVALARLTATQLRQTVSDLYARFSGLPSAAKTPGVTARYYAGGRTNSENLKIERVDHVLNFDFGRQSPGEGIEAEEFVIRWTGGLVAEKSGRYEIIVRSTCSFVMSFGDSRRELINNHVQSGDKTEFRETLYLTGGRVYPFDINFRQRKRKTEQPPAEFSLSWVEPKGVERIIPNRNLVAEWVPPAFALQTELPPDDSSYGYARGIAVNRQWDDSTTLAGLEFADVAFRELWPDYQRKHRKEKLSERELLASFLDELLATMFRAPLSEEQRQRYIHKQLSASASDAEALKRVVLLAFKSPMFLYPTLDQTQAPSRRVANRLALTLFDSLPVDPWIREAVAKDGFANEAAIRAYADAHVEDFRSQAKARDFLTSWLNLRHLDELTKDAEQYAGFDDGLVADLRLSLDRFLDHVVWSESSDYRDLFTTRYSFTTPRLNQFYGEPWTPAVQQSKPAVIGARSGGGVQPTETHDLHLGVVTHPYIMSGLAYYDSTSPIHRGVFLIRYMLGRTLRPPAEAFSPLSPDLHPDLTTRQRVALQTSPESCQVCHAKINPLGFALENYDAVGRFRQQDNGQEVTAGGHYINRVGELVEFRGPTELADYLANSDDAHRAFVARAFQHFVKQPPAAYGADTLDLLVEQFQDKNCSIRELIVDIAVIAASEPLHVGSETGEVANSVASGGDAE